MATSKAPGAAKPQRSMISAAPVQQGKLEVEMGKAAVPCPIAMPQLPLRTPPGAVICRAVKVSPEDAYYKLTVSPEGLVLILDKAFGPGGWCCRRYSCGGLLFTGLGIYVPQVGEYVYKDAAKDGDMDETGLIKAAAMWGICRDVSMLDTIRLTSDQVGILPIPSADGKTIRGYKPDRLTVDKFAWDEVGQIVQIQLVSSKGDKIVWPGT